MEWPTVAAVATAFVTLFIIVSPIGAVPLYLPMTANDPLPRRRRTAIIAAVATTVALALAAVAGDALFRFFGVSINAFRVAGGVLLFLYGMELLQMRQPRAKTTEPEIQEGVHRDEVGIIPLAIPMLAGPGAIATVLVLRGGDVTSLLGLLIAIGMLGVVIAAVLLLAMRLERFLTPVILGVLVRLEGLLSAAIGVQMIISALQSLGALPAGR
jgi:multiple antibiotic resistance protein